MTIAQFQAPGFPSEEVEVVGPADGLPPGEFAFVVHGLTTGRRYLAFTDELSAFESIALEVAA